MNQGIDGGSNPPGSTTSSSKDVYGRLFFCLKSSKYRGFSAFGSFAGFLSSRRLGIPGGIPDCQMLFSGYQNGSGGSPHAY